MKKKAIALLSFLLTAVIIWIAVPRITGAGTNDDRLLIGDVDEDNDVTIIDATAIQRRLADMKRFTELQEFLGDTDGDGVLTVIDATLIQRRLADLGNDFWQESINPNITRINSLSLYTYYPSYSYRDSYSGACVQIEFSAYRYNYKGRYFDNRFEIYVNGEKVAETQGSLSAKYFFDEPGDYTVKVVPYNVFGEGGSMTKKWHVNEAPDRPFIADAEYDEEEQLLRVRAAGGAGEYRYKYYIRYFVPLAPTEAPTECPTEAPTDAPLQPPGPTEAPTEGETIPPFNYDPLPDNTYQLVSEYTSASEIRVPAQMLQTNLEYTFYVSTIDRDDVESDLTQVNYYKY